MEHSAQGYLYDRLGGEAAIEQVVTEFYDRVLADDTVSRYFAGIDMTRQREHMKTFIVFAAGGEKHYTGKSMRMAHEHLGITSAHFDTVLHHMRSALLHCGVGEELIQELSQKIIPLKSEITRGSAE